MVQSQLITWSQIQRIWIFISLKWIWTRQIIILINTEFIIFTFICATIIVGVIKGHWYWVFYTIDSVGIDGLMDMDMNNCHCCSHNIIIIIIIISIIIITFSLLSKIVYLVIFIVVFVMLRPSSRVGHGAKSLGYGHSHGGYGHSHGNGYGSTHHLSMDHINRTVLCEVSGGTCVTSTIHCVGMLFFD